MHLRQRTARCLSTPIYENGKRVYQSPSLNDIKKFCKAQWSTPCGTRSSASENPHRYYVDLSQKLWDTRSCPAEETVQVKHYKLVTTRPFRTYYGGRGVFMLEPIILFALGGAGYQAIGACLAGHHPLDNVCRRRGMPFAFCSNWPGGAACRWGQRRYAALQPPAG